MKSRISTDQAPAAIGPYSQAIKANGFIFASGQVGLDPVSGQVVDGGIREQATRVFENLKAVLDAAGSSFDKVVKTTVFLADFGDFAVMNEVYSSCFSEPYPARSTIEAARLPKDVRIEIELIALE